jgi:hypothetical protein
MPASATLMCVPHAWGEHVDSATAPVGAVAANAPIAPIAAISATATHTFIHLMTAWRSNPFHRLTEPCRRALADVLSQLGAAAGRSAMDGPFHDDTLVLLLAVTDNEHHPSVLHAITVGFLRGVSR